MKKIFILIIICGYSLLIYAQDEPYRGGQGDGHNALFAGTPFGNAASFQPFIGGAADGYAHDSLISFPQSGTINMYAPFAGNTGDGYSHDSLINFSQRDYITMFMPFGGGQADGWAGYPVFGVVLPVELLSFSGMQQGKMHLLKWQTSTEQNTSHFEIERSVNARQFEYIGSITAAGNSNTVKDYRFTDAQPVKGNNFYRLKMTDIDGGFKYSNVILLKQLNDQDVIAVYPNPVTASINVSLAGNNDNSLVQATITDMSGKIVQTVQWRKTNAIQKIELKPFPTGVYTLRIVNNNAVTVWPFIKQ